MVHALWTIRRTAASSVTNVRSHSFGDAENLLKCKLQLSV